ncbi:Lactate dehydrogenase [Pseudomonas antarctica]|uniref:Erythronate-4-phosphate dehydrogenase n=1 Tax=Pseudomonas antarctica TaxID=219572 RepID=A0A1G9YPG5_9PSED|nr:FAD-dependent oxidoreductase [Pseudomonas antarctica]KAF2410681.1 erythronate-4-phosphate dehydrogenase [Pseudomonas antarctica]SDN10505.1 Lactate dehydrogenase [Pseudomonas antarctica]
MRLSSIPSVAVSLIATTENILHIAPASRGWRADAPSNVVFFPPTLAKQALLMQIGLLRPSTIVVGDQLIDADVIDQWRISHPFGALHLVRRGTSLDKVRLDLCETNDIRVVNTPGVNAPHVADYLAHWLTLADGSIPQDVCVLGYGNVGQELVKLLLDRDPEVRIKVLVRHDRAPDTIGDAFFDFRVSFFADWREALEGTSAVALCLSLNAETAHRIDRALIQCLNRQARLVCIAKPDVFSDDALQTLATAEGIQLVLDYGPGTLNAFRVRTEALGCSVSTWCNPAMLTTQAATTEACHCDLDYAVSIQLGLMALHGIVSRKITQIMTIPSEQADTRAPRVSIIGRGINGLLQAVMFRLANYQVTVYGGNQQSDGASHKPVNMRHLSATETTAKPLHNDFLTPGNQYLAVECNRAGIELFEKLLADNPSLARFARSRIVRAYRDDASGVEAAICEQRAIENRPWPSGKPGRECVEISQLQFQASYAIPGIGRAIEVSGYDLEFTHLMAETVRLLQRSGVQFLTQYLNPVQIADLSREHFVVTAMGVEEPEAIAITGWFFKLRAVGNEGKELRGLKLQYDLPIGVMNCRLDGECILVSGGQVPPDAAPAYKEQILTACLAAVSRHFPTSYRKAIERGDLQVIECVRPGSSDGLSIVYWAAYNRIVAGATYAAGTTQGLLWASLVQEIIQARAPGVSATWAD